MPWTSSSSFCVPNRWRNCTLRWNTMGQRRLITSTEHRELINWNSIHMVKMKGLNCVGVAVGYRGRLKRTKRNYIRGTYVRCSAICEEHVKRYYLAVCLSTCRRRDTHFMTTRIHNSQCCCWILIGARRCSDDTNLQKALAVAHAQKELVVDFAIAI